LSGTFLFKVNRLVGTGGDAYPVEVTLGLVDRGETINDGDGMLRTGEDAGTGTTALLEINDDLGHTETFLEGTWTVPAKVTNRRYVVEES
jgi:hypothetical protein